MATLLLAWSCHAQPGTVTLAWDPSPTTGVSYRLYAHTNSLTSTNATAGATVRLDAGTNTTATLAALTPARWHFVATAVKDKLESVPSPELIAEMAAPPAALRTVTLQFNATVTGTNWLDAGFFRIRFGPSP